MFKLNFKVSDEFSVGIERLAAVLGYEIGEGINVTAEKGERIGVSLKDGTAVIYYREKHHFWRELGVLSENAEKGEFDITEDGYFTELSAMFDAARCAVYTVETVKLMIDYLAVMGYSMVMLYTEDLIELENYKYFGYMRGRYSKEEIRAIDDYAYEYGIEAIPCIECYGHMEKYLMWGEAGAMRDTNTVLLAREEKTFTFLDELIGTVSSCFRSKRIHIGMDEANDMGRGRFMDKHGYMPPIEIFTEYMERLVTITRKYGLTPMMWNDMYFRASDPNHGYYNKDIVITDDVKARIPEGVEQVFWHYGEAPYCDEYMLEKCKDLGRKVIFAGATWSWIGHFPEHNYMMESNKFSINACRKTGVREVMETVWFNDNAECPLIANLFGLSYVAELVYRVEPTEAELRSRFEACTGGDYDAFYSMCYYHDTFKAGELETYPSYSRRFRGKPYFWQDILEGLYDTHLYEKPMSSHYAASAEKMRGFKSDRFADLYNYAACVFDYLAVKCEVAEKIAPAYKNGDKATLRELADVTLLKLKALTNKVHLVHRDIWDKYNKVFGWSNMDVRYGGVAARCDTAISRVNAYLDGRLDSLDDLAETRLVKPFYGFSHYSMMSSPNLKT